MDPFAAGIEGMCLLQETKEHSFGQSSFSQYKKMALIFFADADLLNSFKDLYNNMQLPSYRYATTINFLSHTCTNMHDNTQLQRDSAVCGGTAQRTDRAHHRGGGKPHLALR